ncbi:hypothetical protein CVT26_008276 [Gymnopilus dilepis]|uniref:Uncharacterized protein n=1 Tax=Gymnopilus dilepis TaxID=231916 RepID=A0A409WP83_9AGAR|nr:hypothetical protein CVT26_008276 [Gymnopilus dilepis]
MTDWQWTRRVRADGTEVFNCKPCADNRERLAFNIAGHEITTTREKALKRFKAAQSQAEKRSQAVNPAAIIEDALRTLLFATSGNPSQPLYPVSHPSLPPGANASQNTPSPVTGIDWNLLEAVGNTEFEPSQSQQILAQVSQVSLDFLNGDLSDEESVERASVSSNEAATFGGGIGLAEQGLALYFAPSLSAMENRLMAVVNTVATPLQKSDDNDIGDLRGLFRELVIRLEDSFRFTKEQNGNIRRVTQDLIIRPTQIKFKDINIDIELRTNAVMYSLDNIIRRPTRESLLTTTCKRVASGVRNFFRQDIRDSIIGPSTMSLKKFTMDMLVKYRIGNLAVHVEQPYLIFFAILSEPEAEAGDGERQSSPDFEPQLDDSQQSPQTGKKHIEEEHKGAGATRRILQALPGNQTISRDNGRFDPSSRRDPQAASPDKSYSSANLSLSSSEDQQTLTVPQVFSQSAQSSSSLPPMSSAQGSTSFTFAAPSPSPVLMNSVSPSGSGFSGILLAAQGF